LIIVTNLYWFAVNVPFSVNKINRKANNLTRILLLPQNLIEITSLLLVKIIVVKKIARNLLIRIGLPLRSKVP